MMRDESGQTSIRHTNEEGGELDWEQGAEHTAVFDLRF
jgi:hypothetical protein